MAPRSHNFSSFPFYFKFFINDTDFKIIGKKATEYIKNECPLQFMFHTIKYYLSFVIRVKEQLNKYLE